jgi:citrate synthase
MLINMINMTAMKPALPTIAAEQVLARLKISRPTLYAYVSRGLIRAAPDPEDPRRSRYRVEDVERLASRKARGRKPERVAEGTLDWGLPVLESRITLIDGGRLFYRGRDAAQLATSATLEDVARLLWDCGGADPFAAAPARPPARWGAMLRALVDVAPVDRCLAMLPLAEGGILAMSGREASRLWPGAAALLRHVAAAAVAATPDAAPIDAMLARAWKIGAARAKLIRAALVLSADHELNASTFATRVIASTGASLTASIAGGLAALSGPRHGGVTAQVEAWFDEIERSGDPARAVADRVQRGDRLPGFGHPLYPEGDPRAGALLALLPRESLRDRVIAAVDRIGGRPPNIDFALVALSRALGLPRGAAFTVFAIGRTVGWIAHALEQQADEKLIRPRARYAGPAPEAAVLR